MSKRRMPKAMKKGGESKAKDYAAMSPPFGKKGKSGKAREKRLAKMAM